MTTTLNLRDPLPQKNKNIRTQERIIMWKGQKCRQKMPMTVKHQMSTKWR